MQQLVGNDMLDHELWSIAIRRQTQQDYETLALAHNTSTRFSEIQNQFIGPSVQHAIEACQLFYIPAILRSNPGR